MSRSNAAANTTASQAAHVRPITFVKLEFDSGTLRLHNGVGRYEWGLDDSSPPATAVWTGLGAIVSISPIKENDQLSPQRVSFALNALDQTLLDELDSEELFERVVTVYWGYLGDDGALTADPDERWRGFMDHSEISLGEVDAIHLHCESEMVRDFRANGGMFTEEDQQERYSGDVGFQYLDQMAANPRVHWGPNGERVFFGDPPTAPFRPDDYWPPGYR